MNDEAKRFKELNRFSENAKNKFNSIISELFKSAFTTHFEKALKENRPPQKKEIENFSIKTIASDDGKKLLEFTQDVLLLSLLLGNEHADRRVQLADDDFGIGASFGVPSKDALEYLKSQIPLTKDEYAELERKVQFRAFTVSKLAEADFVNKAKMSLIDGIEHSKSFSEIWDEFKKIGSEAGVDISAGYFETVYRTNIQSAYNAGRLMRYKNNQPPAWELLFMEDGNMSEICTALMNEVGGKAIKSDDPFWSTVGFPPYHYNCRTTFRAVYDYELNEGEIALAAPKESAPLDNGFGGNPLEKESWWKLTDTMKERAKEYGLKDGIEAMAKKLGVKDFTLENIGKLKTTQDSIDITSNKNITKNNKHLNTRNRAIEILKKDLGFSKVENIDKFNGELLITTTKQIKKLEENFRVLDSFIDIEISNIKDNNINGNIVAGVSFSKGAKRPTVMLSDKFFSQSKKDIALIIEKTIKNKHHMPCSPNNYCIYPITHEYGHLVEQKLFLDHISKNNKLISQKHFDDFTKKLKDDIISIANEQNKNFIYENNISRYGDRNPAEFFAECFANSQLGEPNELGHAMIKFLKKSF